MKKLLSLFLALTMVMGILVIVPFTASADTADDHLITHWDFVGDTPYADKATKGSVANTLTAGGAVTCAEGYATIAADSYLKADEAEELMRTNADDITNNTADKTLYMVFKPTSLPTGTTEFASQQSGFRVRFDASSNTLSGSTASSAAGENWWCNGYSYTDASQWITLAVTYDRDTTTETLNITSYYKVGSGDWKTFSRKADKWQPGHGVSENAQQDMGFYLAMGNNTKCSVDLIFDDVRIYDSALTADQVKGIVVTNAAFDPDDHLVSHWDFAGSNPTADKATGSRVANDLIASGTVTYENGLATVKANSYLKAAEARELMRTNADDITNNTADKTLYMVFKPASLPTGTTEFASQQSGFRVRFDASSNTLSGSTASSSAGQNWWCNGYSYTDASQWITLAVTFDRDTSTSTLNIASYYKVGDGEWKTFSKKADTWQQGYGGENEQQDNGFYLAMGNNTKCSVDLIFDDVRIYDTALSADTIKSIVITNPETPAPVVPTVEGKGHSLTLDGNIGVNFLLAPNAEAADAVVTIKNGDTVLVENAKFDDAHKNGESYKFTAEVSAKEMSDELTLTVTLGEEVIYTDAYSVMEYGLYVIDHYSDYNTKTLNLVRAMLNYGCYTQAYFNYNTDKIGYTKTKPTTLEATTAYDFTVSGSVAGLSAQAATLVLDSKTEITVAFAMADGAALADYTVAGGTAVEKDGVIYVTTAGVCAQDLDVMQTVTVTKGSETLTVSYAPMSYVAANADNSGSNVDLLVRALNDFRVAAEAYTA